MDDAKAFDMIVVAATLLFGGIFAALTWSAPTAGYEAIGALVAIEVAVGAPMFAMILSE